MFLLFKKKQSSYYNAHAGIMKEFFGYIWCKSDSHLILADCHPGQHQRDVTKNIALQTKNNMASLPFLPWRMEYFKGTEKLLLSKELSPYDWQAFNSNPHGKGNRKQDQKLNIIYHSGNGWELELLDLYIW